LAALEQNDNWTYEVTDWVGPYYCVLY